MRNARSRPVARRNVCSIRRLLLAAAATWLLWFIFRTRSLDDPTEQKEHSSDFSPSAANHEQIFRGLRGTSRAHITGRIVGQDYAEAHKIIGGKANFPPIAQMRGSSKKVKRYSVVVVGGGIAGLSAAWRLQQGKEGRRKLHIGTDVLVLELENEAGGNAGSFTNDVGSYPRAGHYIVPATSQCREWRQLLHDIRVILNFDEDGEPEYDNRFWVKRPDERVFVKGQWESEFPPLRTEVDKKSSGLWSRLVYGSSRRKDGCSVDDATLSLDRQGKPLKGVKGLQELRDSAGHPAFAIPLDRSSRSPQFAELRGLDNISISEFMSKKTVHQVFDILARASRQDVNADALRNFLSEISSSARFADSPAFRWLVDYYMKDEFGSNVGATSAWAALHYWAARDCGDEFLTWPAGNGHISKQLTTLLGGPRGIRTQALVFAVTPTDGGTRELGPDEIASAKDLIYAIDYYDKPNKRSKRVLSRYVIYSAPRFTAPFVISGYAKFRDTFVKDFTYSPWLTAFVTLTEQPPELGNLSWDNVMSEGLSVGYVVSTHQNKGPKYRGPSVWTYYRPIAEENGNVRNARQKLISTSWDAWCAEILADIGQAHPGIENFVSNVDIWLMGHAMIRPRPDFVWSNSRRSSTEEHRRFPQNHGRVIFGHSDMSGIPIIEEANYWGVQAADTVLAELSRND